MPPCTIPKHAWPGRASGHVRRARPPGPADRAREGRLRRVPRRRIRQALVERMQDVDPERVLHLDDELRRQQVLGAAVEVGAEAHPILADGPERGEAPHLVAAGVREDRAVPRHEAVEPAELARSARARGAGRGDRCWRGRSRRRSPGGRPASGSSPRRACPTGMKAGVSTAPCGGVEPPAPRAAVPRQQLEGRSRSHAGPRPRSASRRRSCRSGSPRRRRARRPRAPARGRRRPRPGGAATSAAGGSW